MGKQLTKQPHNHLADAEHNKGQTEKEANFRQFVVNSDAEIKGKQEARKKTKIPTRQKNVLIDRAFQKFLSECGEK